MSDDTSGTISKVRPKTDWRRLRRMTAAEVHQALVSDPDVEPSDEEFWKSARLVIPSARRP